MRLLETLVCHVGVALKNGHLEASLAQVTELKDELHQLTMLDTLTGLANRQRLYQELKRILLERSGRSAVVFIDPDDFKSINDTVDRLGGDEYTLLLERLGGPDNVIPVAERILALVGQTIDAAGISISTQVSIGIAMVAANDSADGVIRRADTAMYAAKADGKGRYRIYHNGMHGVPLRSL